MIKRLRFWVGLGLSIFFLAWLFRGTDVGRIATALKGVNYLWIVLSLPVYFLGVWFRAGRWARLLGPIKYIPSRKLFPFLIIGFMANNVLPARIGELVRAYFLGEREGLSKTAVFATIIIERVLDGLTLLLFLITISFFVPLAPWLQAIAGLGGILFVGVLALLYLATISESLTLRTMDLLWKPLPESSRKKLRGWLGLFLGGTGALRSPRRLWSVSMLSIVVWLAEAATYYMVGLGFDLKVPIYGILLVTSTANLGTSIPSSQGGIGPFEFLGAQTLSSLSVDASVASAYAIVLHAVLLVPVILLGFFYLWKENLSLTEPVKKAYVEGVGERV